MSTHAIPLGGKCPYMPIFSPGGVGAYVHTPNTMRFGFHGMRLGWNAMRFFSPPGDMACMEFKSDYKSDALLTIGAGPV